MILWANPWYAEVANASKNCPSLTKSGLQDAYSCRQKEHRSTLLFIPLWTLSKMLTEPVANRVAEIRASSSSEQWKYVPTKEDPDDLATRGMTVSQLANSEI